MSLRSMEEVLDEVEQEKVNKELEKDTYTPLFDYLVQFPSGLIKAAVYGKIWRYSQMKQGKCTISVLRLAGELGLHRNTISKTLDWLCNNGLVVDVSKGNRGRTDERHFAYNEEYHTELTRAYHEYAGNWKAPEITVVE